MSHDASRPSVLSVDNRPFAISDGRQHLLTLLSLADMLALARTCHAWYATAAKPARRRDVVTFNCHQLCLGGTPTMTHHVQTLAFAKGQYTETCFAYGHFFPCLTELRTRILLHDQPCSQCDNQPTFPTTLTALHIQIVNRMYEPLVATSTAFQNQIGQLASLRQLRIDSKRERSWTLTDVWIRGLPNLTTLSFANKFVEMDDNALRQLGALSHLTDLDLFMYEWTTDRLGTLLGGPTVPPLQRFNHGRHNIHARPILLRALQPLAPTLVDLDYHDHHTFPLRLLDWLTVFSNLTNLDMTADGQENVHVKDAFANTQFANMSRLRLEGFVLDEPDIQFAEQHWPRLTQLTLDVCWTHAYLVQSTFPFMQTLVFSQERNPYWTSQMSQQTFVGMPNMQAHVFDI